MGMKSRSEKKMRKHLIEQLKLRKINGARIAQGFKTETDLINLNMGPQLFLFKNLFSGQVIYSQVPAIHQDQIDEQFTKPNWQNRKPSRRDDLWRIMCIGTFSNYEYAVAAYKGLVDLRKARDVTQSKQAMQLRKKNDEGNIWYSGQYRPTWSQESIADLSHVIDEFELENTTLLWENLWRKGEDKYWRMDLINHEELPPYNPKYQTAFLDQIRETAVAEFKKQREEVEANIIQEQPIIA